MTIESTRDNQVKANNQFYPVNEIQKRYFHLSFAILDNLLRYIGRESRLEKIG